MEREGIVLLNCIQYVLPLKMCLYFYTVLLICKWDPNKIWFWKKYIAVLTSTDIFSKWP